MIPRAIWRLTAYCAPAFHLNFQVTRPAKPVKQPQTEVGYRISVERKVIPHPTSESRHSTSDRCYPLLFQKIKSNIANEINWLMKADSIFPCIYSEFSESSPASISVDRFCIERKVGADLRKLMAAEGSFGHVEALHAGISELKDGLCDLTRKQLDIATR